MTTKTIKIELLDVVPFNSVSASLIDKYILINGEVIKVDDLKLPNGPQGCLMFHGASLEDGGIGWFIPESIVRIVNVLS